MKRWRERMLWKQWKNSGGSWGSFKEHKTYIDVQKEERDKYKQMTRTKEAEAKKKAKETIIKKDSSKMSSKKNTIKKEDKKIKKEDLYSKILDDHDDDD